MAPGSMSTAPMAASSCCARRGGRCLAGSSRRTAWRSIRTRPCSCPTAPARSWSGRGAHLFDAFSASADYIQRIRRERCRPVARRSVARADPPFPGASALAAAAARRRRRLSRRPVGEDRPRPLFPRAAVGDGGLGRRAAAGPLGRRLPLPPRGRRQRLQRPAAARASSRRAGCSSAGRGSGARPGCAARYCRSAPI